MPRYDVFDQYWPAMCHRNVNAPQTHAVDCISERPRKKLIKHVHKRVYVYADEM